MQMKEEVIIQSIGVKYKSQGMLRLIVVIGVLEEMRQDEVLCVLGQRGKGC